MSNKQWLLIIVIALGGGIISGIAVGVGIDDSNYQDLAIQHQCAHYEHTPDKNTGEFVWNNVVEQKGDHHE